jgi:hypothetical protein
MDHDTPPPVQMVQLLAGFQLSQALYAVAKLDVATVLERGPKSVKTLADEVGAAAEPLARLLRTLASVGLFVETQPGTYATTPLGATLAADAPGSMRDLALMWMETHYAPFGGLVDTIRTGACAATSYYGQPFFEWLACEPEQVARFTGAMANLTDGIKAAALAGYRLPPGGVVVDVGGADGTLLTTVLAADPDPTRRGVVFDLPHVCAAAAKRVAERGLADRVEAVGGDFFAAVPTGDVYLVSMILHDWDDASCHRLLRTIARSGRAGARLCAVEFVVPPGDVPHMSKMIDLTMLGMLTGKERTAEEFEALLAGAGFRLDRIVDAGSPMSVLEATLVDAP